jgi:tetraacyldisaccharide-1-P 4'-kinase
MGFNPAGVRFFEDHHAYTARDFGEIVCACRAVGAKWLLTSMKDVVKVCPYGFDDILVYIIRPVVCQVAGEEMVNVLVGSD